MDFGNKCLFSNIELLLNALNWMLNAINKRCIALEK